MYSGVAKDGVGPGDLIAHSAQRGDVIAAGAGLVVFIERWYRLDQGRVAFPRLDARSSATVPRNQRNQEIDISSTEAHDTSSDQSVGKVDMKLENQIIPVSDVDRAKQFCERLGWRLDDDVAPLQGLRIVQFTPPRSGTSVTFGLGLTTAAPGSAEASLTVSDIEAAHDELVGRGIGVSDIWHGPPFPVEARQPGPDPERASYGSFCYFTDPDGNTWIVQEVTTRRPGREW